MKPGGRPGLLVAVADLPFTFERTLMPRATADQALATGLSFGSNHALVELVQDSIRALAWMAIGSEARRDRDDGRWRRATLGLDGLAMLVGLGVQRGLAPRARESLPRAAARTTGYWLSATGAAGAVTIGLGELARGGRSRKVPAALAAAGAALLGCEVVRRLDRGEGPRAPGADPGARGSDGRAKALGLGLATAGVMSGFGLVERRAANRIAAGASRVLPGSEAVWQPVGHLVTLASLGVAAKALVGRTLDRIEHRETSFEGAFDFPPPNPLVSGSHESLVDFATLSKQGRRFVWTVTTDEQIETVLGEPATRTPIRAYVGLGSAADDAARVRLLIDELDRTGAFERAWLLVMAPTGTGYLNYAAAGAFEVLTRGDCATAGIQYAARPSVLSLDRVKHGRHVYRQLFAALRDRLAEIPEGSRPEVVLFGESLGSWASQDAFVDHGTQGLVDHGIDRAIWIGTPAFSKWKERVLYDERPDVDRRAIAVCNSITDWEAMDPEERARARYVMVTHHNDGVALFGPPLLIQEPPWLRDRSTRPPEVPSEMTWMPNTTFFQVLIDMKNSTNVVAGRFDDNGHDYRGSLVPFFRAVLDLPATPDQLDALERWLEARELMRTQWIEHHGDLASSMSARVLEVLYQEARERGEDPDARLVDAVRRVAAEDFAAGGGAAATSDQG